MYLEEEMEQLYKIINKRLYNNDLPVPYFRMHNARYRKKGWNIQYKQNKVCQIDINQKSLDNDKNIVLEMLHQMVHIYIVGSKIKKILAEEVSIIIRFSEI